MVLVFVLTSFILMAVTDSIIALASEAEVQQSDESYFDNFASYAVGTVPSGWTVYGTPEISPNVVTHGGTGSNYHRLEFPAYVAEQTHKWLVKDGLTVGEATITVKLNFQTSSDGGGLVLGWEDSDNLIAVMPNPFWDEITVWEFVDGEVSRTWNSGGRNTVSIQTNQDYWLRVVTHIDEAEGNQLLAYWSTDGSTFFEEVVANNVSRLEGQVGVGTYQFLSHTLFDDFHVEYADIVSPAPIPDLAAESGVSAGHIDLTWTAPGADAGEGTASKYIVRYAEAAIETEFGWTMATDVDNEPTPQSAGSTESMTVSGLTPGETYYFAIRAEDEDGNISGLSNSPGAVAKEAPDLGFRPDPNGFQFANQQIWRSWEMFEQYFGTENVRHPNGDTCLAAEQYFGEEYQTVANGWACLGFSQASLLSYMNVSQSNAGPFAIAHYDQLYQQPLSTSLTDSIAFYAGVQTSQQWANEFHAWAGSCDSNDSAMIDGIRNSIESGRPIVVSLNTGLTSWHTISPYRIEDVSSSEYHVYVYDSEAPGQAQLLEIKNDGNDWKWEYTFVGSVGAAGTKTGGCKDMYPLSLDIAVERGVPPVNFCETPGNDMLDSNGSEITLTKVPVTQNWVIQNDQGQRFGWVGDKFISEIPDAYIIPQTLGQALPESHTVALPTASYTFETKVSESDSIEQTLFADGRFLHLSGTGNSPTATIQITTMVGLGGMLVNNVSQFSSISVSADSEQSGASRLGVITMTTSNESESLYVHFDGQQLQLKPTGSQILYDLELRNSSGQHFIYQHLELLSTDTHFLVPTDWNNLNEGEIQLQIDRDSDGTVDETVVLAKRDDSSPLYLPVLTK
jgi:hypothetical protein